ncbi:MAG TPA: DUF2332 domain-containing protein [Caulobacteraceae bacterium]|nr:DUF2332 domain-containing protein [Caulobacteraceae bacterium]
MTDPLERMFRSQAEICAAFGSPFYAALAGLVVGDLGELSRIFAPWQGQTIEVLMGAAVSLRFLGALHDLALSGDDLAVSAAFPPVSDAAAAWDAARAAIERDPARFEAFMAHEPQTNEVRRSACLLPGFLTIAAETGLPLACLELGASAGLNQLWNRYAYDYGEAGRWGDASSPLTLDSAWSGPAPLWNAAVSVAHTSACDRKPIDLTDPLQRRRLKAYLWPDQTERIERFDAAVSMALAAGTRVESADAADWTLARAAPREGVATVVFHSIFWQYLPAETKAALRAALETHGAAATTSAPLAWLRMEPIEGQAFPIELRLTLWPGGEDRRLATVHAHGANVSWEG